MFNVLSVSENPGCSSNHILHLSYLGESMIIDKEEKNGVEKTEKQINTQKKASTCMACIACQLTYS
jgi:hypothetical protein